MKKKMAVLAFICVFSVLISSINITVAEAASTMTAQNKVSNSIVGWENWKPTYYASGGVKLYCPYEGATIDDIFYYINKLISENMGILNERYGEVGYNPLSLDLIFNWPDFGNHPDDTYTQLAQYFYSAVTFYNGNLIQFMVWNNTGLSDKGKGISQIEIALTNNRSQTWTDHYYNPSTGAYERTDVEFYDSLDDITEYKTFGTRTGNWVQNESLLYSYGMYRLMNVDIIRSQFEIFDEASFDRSILNQPYTRINSINKTEGKYVMVKHLSITDVEPAVQDKLQVLCENAKKASDTQAGQIKYINDYLCSHVKYDYNFYNWLKSDRKTPYDSNKGILPNNAYGALVDGSAICTGFTHAVEEACNYLGIPNFHIENGTHAWNMVYIDNQWKNLDVTWNATGNDTSRYFLVDNITDSSGSHSYDSTEVEASKKVALTYLGYNKYFEYNTEHQLMIKNLVDKGIFTGDDKGELNLEKGLTRAELATLLTRLSGQENSVKEKSLYYASISPFTDVPTWATPYVGYCFEQGLLKGYSINLFGANDTVNVKMACTVILRYLGYKETDWGYDSSVEKMKSIGIMPTDWPTGTTALRNDIAIMINYTTKKISYPYLNG